MFLGVRRVTVYAVQGFSGLIYPRRIIHVQRVRQGVIRRLIGIRPFIMGMIVGANVLCAVLLGFFWEDLEDQSVPSLCVGRTKNVRQSLRRRAFRRDLIRSGFFLIFFMVARRITFLGLKEGPFFCRLFLVPVTSRQVAVFLRRLVRFHLVFSLRITRNRVMSRYVFRPLPFRAFNGRRAIDQKRSTQSLLFCLQASRDPILRFCRRVHVVRELHSLAEARRECRYCGGRTVSRVAFSLLFLYRFARFLRRLPICHRQMFPIRLFSPLNFHLNLLIRQLIPGFLVTSIRRRSTVPVLFRGGVRLEVFHDRVLAFNDDCSVSSGGVMGLLRRVSHVQFHERQATLSVVDRLALKGVHTVRVGRDLIRIFHLLMRDEVKQGVIITRDL